MASPMESEDSAPVSTQKISTGVPGLDYLLRGGLPVHRTHLVEGHPAPVKPR